MKGYIRKDGRIGIRNHVAVMYTVECAHHVARQIVERTEGAELVGFAGCYSDDYAFRMLVELGKHPNVAAVLIISLGCESTDVFSLHERITESGKRAEVITIQRTGGTVASIEKGVQLVQEMVSEAASVARVPLSYSDLVIGVECGGSDTTSGIAANPATGNAVDQLVDRGASVIFSEIPELLGCDNSLLTRVQNEQTRQRLVDGLARAEKLGSKIAAYAISAGNHEGGLTTIEEKSLGALCKAGTRPITSILRTGEHPVEPGLHLLDKVGIIDSHQLTHYEENDNDGLITLLASGAHLILFTTGRGSVVGSALAPVIKICGNPTTSILMADNMDIDASGIVNGITTVKETGELIVQYIASVVDGKQTKAERLGHKEYYIPYKPTRACDLL